MRDGDRKRLEELANEMPGPGWEGLEAFWRQALYDRSPYEVAETVSMHVGMAIRCLLEELGKTHRPGAGEKATPTHPVCQVCGETWPCRAVAGEYMEVVARLRAENAKLRKAVSRVGFALSESERVIRAYTTPLGGMGTNILQEDRCHAASALREIERAREALKEAGYGE